MRRLAALLLVFSMLSHSVPVAGGAVDILAGKLEHAMLHLQEVEHHHHQDGSLHQDESVESDQHMKVGAGQSLAALFQVAPPLNFVTSGGEYSVFHDPRPPSRDLSPLRRPPKQSA